MAEWEMEFSTWLNTTIPGMIVGSLMIMFLICAPATLMFLWVAKPDKE